MRLLLVLVLVLLTSVLALPPAVPQDRDALDAYVKEHGETIIKTHVRRSLAAKEQVGDLAGTAAVLTKRMLARLDGMAYNEKIAYVERMHARLTAP